MESRQASAGEFVTHRAGHAPIAIALGFDFYGSGNIGDDLMLDGFLQAAGDICRANALTLYATSAHHIESQRRRFPQVRWGLPEEPVDVWAGVGDTPFQITVGDWMLRFLQRELLQTAAIPRHIVVGVGAESEITSHAAEFGEVANRFDRISVRDEHSYRIIVQELKVPESRVIRGADLAHLSLAKLFPAPWQDKTFELGIIIAGDLLSAADLGELARFLETRTEPTAFIAGETRMHSSFEWGVHQDMLGRLSQAGANKTPFCCPPYADGSMADLVRPIAECRTIISSRYHGILAAAWAGCRVAAIGRSSKVTALARELDIPLATLPLEHERLGELARIARPVPPERLQLLAGRAREMVRFSFADF